MKRVIQFLSTLVLGMGFLSSVASAASVTCGASNTGANSNNTVVCQTSNNEYVTCNNGVVVLNNNGQTAHSGDAFVINNTNAGGSTSGNTTNVNGVEVEIGVTGCAPVTTTSTTPTPTAPSGGGGAGQPAAPVQAAPKVASLPATGSNSVVETLAIGTALVGGAVAVSQIGLMAYRRLALK